MQDDTQGTARRKELAERAFPVFLDKGFAAASMAELARAVGLSKASLYHHFSSKEALFVAAISGDQHERIAQLHAIADDPTLDHWQRVEKALALCYDSIVASNAGRMIAVIAQTSKTFPIVAQGFHDDYITPLEDGIWKIYTQGRDAGSFAPMEQRDVFHIFSSIPVNLGLCREMFGGLELEAEMLDMPATIQGHLEILRKVLAP